MFDEMIENIVKSEESIESGSKKKAPSEKIRFKKVIDVIYKMCNLAGFHVVGKIQLKDVRTGKIWE